MTALVDGVDIDKPLPKYGQSIKCGRSDCEPKNWETGYGLAGGGCGVYKFCNICEQVVEKTLEEW